MGYSTMLGYVHGDHVLAPFDASKMRVWSEDVGAGFVPAEGIIDSVVEQIQGRKHISGNEARQLLEKVTQASMIMKNSFLRTQAVGVRSGPVIDRARNHVTQMFKDNVHIEWLLMADADATFTYDDICKIVVAGAADPERFPVIGGLAFALGEDDELTPTLYNRSPKGGYLVYRQYPPDSLCEVDYTGCHFLLIHRTVIEKIGTNWFGYMHEQYGSAEDFAFCHRVREAGFKIHVHTGVKTGHAKLKVWTEQDYLKQQTESSPTIIGG